MLREQETKTSVEEEAAAAAKFYDQQKTGRLTDYSPECAKFLTEFNAAAMPQTHVRAVVRSTIKSTWDMLPVPDMYDSVDKPLSEAQKKPGVLPKEAEDRLVQLRQELINDHNVFSEVRKVSQFLRELSEREIKKGSLVSFIPESSKIDSQINGVEERLTTLQDYVEKIHEFLEILIRHAVDNEAFRTKHLTSLQEKQQATKDCLGLLRLSFVARYIHAVASYMGVLEEQYLANRSFTSPVKKGITKTAQETFSEVEEQFKSFQTTAASMTESDRDVSILEVALGKLIAAIEKNITNLKSYVESNDPESMELNKILKEVLESLRGFKLKLSSILQSGFDKLEPLVVEIKEVEVKSATVDDVDPLQVGDKGTKKVAVVKEGEATLRTELLKYGTTGGGLFADSSADLTGGGEEKEDADEDGDKVPKRLDFGSEGDEGQLEEREEEPEETEAEKNARVFGEGNSDEGLGIRTPAPSSQALTTGSNATFWSRIFSVNNLPLIAAALAGIFGGEQNQQNGRFILGGIVAALVSAGMHFAMPAVSSSVEDVTDEEEQQHRSDNSR